MSGKMLPNSVDPAVKEWATERQCEIIDAYNASGSVRKARHSVANTPSRSKEKMVR